MSQRNMTHRTLRSSVCFAALLLAAVSLAAQTPPPLPPPLPPELPDSPGATIQPAIPTGPTVVFDTTMGRLTCKLFEKEAPIAAANFVQLAEGTKDWTDPVTNQKVHGKRFYDSTTFHRVIPGFMIQGGDRKGDGTGDAGYYFDNEVSTNVTFNVAGRLAMANAGPNTNGTQFFITEAAQPELDGKYTIFGQCDAHTVLMVATIARVDRNANDKPTTPIVVNKVSVVREGQPMPPDPAPPAPAPAAPAVSAMPPVKAPDPPSANTLVPMPTATAPPGSRPTKAAPTTPPID
jgi:peptidyl-prolyl cis-trans isomerase A (cyclophilin A)